MDHKVMDKSKNYRWKLNKRQLSVKLTASEYTALTAPKCTN